MSVERSTGPRIAPVSPPYPAALEAQLSRWMPPGSPIDPLLLFRTLAIHDELFSRMRPIGSGLLNHGRIDPRRREIVILRTCARAGAGYEWGVHVTSFAARVGLNQDEIQASATGTVHHPAWSHSATDQLMVELADELHETCTVSDRLWSLLSAEFAADELLELVILAGWYRLLSGVINATRVQPEPWAARFPARERADG